MITLDTRHIIPQARNSHARSWACRSSSPVVVGRTVTGVGKSVIPSWLGHFNLVDGEIDRPPLWVAPMIRPCGFVRGEEVLLALDQGSVGAAHRRETQLR